MDDVITTPMTPPNDVRGFVHKRIGRAVGGFVRSGFNPLAAATAFISSPTDRPVIQSRAAKVAVIGATRPARGFAACGAGMAIDPRDGTCKRRSLLNLNLPFGGAPGMGLTVGGFPSAAGARPAGGGGVAVMGRFGAALVPASRIIDRADCTFGGTVRGMILGEDDLCYNKGQIKNSERRWPRGRRPLLTGGDMRAISIASRAASRLTRTAVRLHEIGLIKKPIARKPRKSKH